MTATLSMERNSGALNLSSQNQYVSFLIGEQLLGVPVDIVQEVLNPQAIARTPKARPEIAGLLNLRGQIVTAVDLRKRLHLPENPTGKPSMNVVIRHKGESYSLLVDEVGDVINVSSEQFESAPPTLDAHWKSLISGVFRLEEKLFVVLHVPSVFSL